MWKKFLSTVAAVAVLATNSALVAFAAVPTHTYVTSVSVSPDVLDPDKAETVKISYTLEKDVVVSAEVLDPSGQAIDGLGTKVSQTGGVHADAYTWDGKNQSGVFVADGTYKVRVYAWATLTSADPIDYTDDQVVVYRTTTPLPEGSEKPEVTNISVDPTTLSNTVSEVTDLTFTINKTASVTIKVHAYNVEGVDKGTLVKSFDNYTDRYLLAGTYSVSWDGANNSGTDVKDGLYTFEIMARNTAGHTLLNWQLTDDLNNSNEVIDSLKVTVDSTGSSSSSGVLKDVKLDPASNWDPTDEELEIDYELTSDVSFLRIDAELRNSSNQVLQSIEIVDDEDVDDGDYTESWDGTDDDGDYVDQGVWTIILRADNFKVEKDINVSYEQPGVVEALVTKESFDPDKDEFTTLVYKVDTDSIVTIDVYKGSSKEFTLVDEEEVRKNRFYTIAWDGTDEDGEDVDEGTDWKFRIVAENETDNDISDTVEVEVDVEEDDVSDNKSNVTNDFMFPAVFDEDQDEELTIAYEIDEDAEVYIAIYEGNTTSGSTEIELLDYVEQDSGEHTVSWDATNEDGKNLDDGTFSYKIVSKVGTRKDTETGKFVVGNVGEAVEPKPEPKPEEKFCTIYWDLDYLDANDELCSAVEWATDMGIVSGYSDGSFKDYNYVNRAEFLKMILETFGNIAVLPADGNNYGFSDVDPWAWYMSYVRTAKAYGMISGYADGTARLNNTINRAEVLKFALEAARAFAGYSIPNASYSYYIDVPADAWFVDYSNVSYSYILLDDYNYGGGYNLQPASLVTRGEVVTLLYRMSQNGIL